MPSSCHGSKDTLGNRLHLSNGTAGCSSSARDTLHSVSHVGWSMLDAFSLIAGLNATGALTGRGYAGTFPLLASALVVLARVPEPGGGDGFKLPQNHAPP